MKKNLIHYVWRKVKKFFIAIAYLRVNIARKNTRVFLNKIRYIKKLYTQKWRNYAQEYFEKNLKRNKNVYTHGEIRCGALSINIQRCTGVARNFPVHIEEKSPLIFHVQLSRAVGKLKWRWKMVLNGFECTSIARKRRTTTSFIVCSECGTRVKWLSFVPAIFHFDYNLFITSIRVQRILH